MDEKLYSDAVRGADTAMPSSGIMTMERAPVLGWLKTNGNPDAGFVPLAEAVEDVDRAYFVIQKDGALFAAEEGSLGPASGEGEGCPVAALLPASPMKMLGDPTFCRDYDLQYPYAAGSMAHGISSTEMVKALVKEGMLGFYGAAGQPLRVVEKAVDELQKDLPGKIYGCNLIHSPNEPKLEMSVVDLYLKTGIKLAEASAFLGLTLPLVKFRVSGIYRDGSGKVTAPNRVLGKVSREEVAEKFFSPPPVEMLQKLVDSGDITQEQAEMARQIPVARDLTAEADSGGHTDHRPAVALIPTLLALKDGIQKKFEYPDKLRVGAAGGISTPASAAAAFAMGAAYVMTGSVNQACVEAGTSDVVKKMLAETRQADITRAHAADMFEMGVTVQVIKRGTMFAMRSAKLYDYYNNYKSIDEIPAPERTKIEKMFFRRSFADVWQSTCEYFSERDETQLARAKKDPRHKMALIFRWYLSQTSHWAIAGDPVRRMDYQVWCGPSMGAFNRWVQGAFLDDVSERKTAVVGLNLLHGAAVLSRLTALRRQGIDLLPQLNPVPLKLSEITD